MWTRAELISAEEWLRKLLKLNQEKSVWPQRGWKKQSASYGSGFARTRLAWPMGDRALFQIGTVRHLQAASS